MKTAREYIADLRLNRANVEHILQYGNVNGTLLIDLENTLHAYAEEVAQQALKDAASNMDKECEDFGGLHDSMKNVIVSTLIVTP